MRLHKDMFKDVPAGSDYRIPKELAVQIHREYLDNSEASLTEIAEWYDVPIEAVCNIVAGAKGISLAQSAHLMREEGYTNKEIAATHGVSVRSVQRIFAT